ncbi:MAG: hypothetical protein A2Y33_12875 [Spirochaetes bacterium GWF1_51_8]|nr:MAG: hypothetical protein A2Y33_12875 [Spirochaetes bacterium GWF1_51_8]
MHFIGAIFSFIIFGIIFRIVGGIFGLFFKGKPKHSQQFEDFKWKWQNKDSSGWKNDFQRKWNNLWNNSPASPEKPKQQEPEVRPVVAEVIREEDPVFVDTSYHPHSYDLSQQAKKPVDDSIPLKEMTIEKDTEDPHRRSKSLPDGDLKHVIARCEDKLTEIRNMRRSLKKQDIIEKVSSITDNIGNIMDTFIARPSSLKTAKRFTDYYLDATIKILKKYIELSSFNIQSPAIDKGIVQAEKAMDTINSAFVNILIRLREDDVMDLNTEIQVLENEMKMDGFKE